MNIPENMKEITNLASKLVNPILPQMEDFVTLEIAKKLKEKGFPIKTKTEGKFGLTKVKEVEILPTISQVLKWLREERKIHIEIGFGCYGFCWDLTLNIKYVEGYNNSEWDLLDGEKYKEIDNQGNHSTYEQCALCAIEYILDNLI